MPLNPKLEGVTIVTLYRNQQQAESYRNLRQKIDDFKTIVHAIYENRATDTKTLLIVGFDWYFLDDGPLTEAQYESLKMELAKFTESMPEVILCAGTAIWEKQVKDDSWVMSWFRRARYDVRNSALVFARGECVACLPKLVCCGDWENTQTHLFTGLDENGCVPSKIFVVNGLVLSVEICAENCAEVVKSLLKKDYERLQILMRNSGEDVPLDVFRDSPSMPIDIQILMSAGGRLVEEGMVIEQCGIAVHVDSKKHRIGTAFNIFTQQRHRLLSSVCSHDYLTTEHISAFVHVLRKEELKDTTLSELSVLDFANLEICYDALMYLTRKSLNGTLDGYMRSKIIETFRKYAKKLPEQVVDEVYQNVREYFDEGLLNELFCDLRLEPIALSPPLPVQDTFCSWFQKEVEALKDSTGEVVANTSNGVTVHMNPML